MCNISSKIYETMIGAPCVLNETGKYSAEQLEGILKGMEESEYHLSSGVTISISESLATVAIDLGENNYPSRYFTCVVFFQTDHSDSKLNVIDGLTHEVYVKHSVPSTFVDFLAQYLLCVKNENPLPDISTLDFRRHCSDKMIESAEFLAQLLKAIGGEPCLKNILFKSCNYRDVMDLIRSMIVGLES